MCVCAVLDCWPSICYKVVFTLRFFFSMATLHYRGQLTHEFTNNFYNIHGGGHNVYFHVRRVHPCVCVCYSFEIYPVIIRSFRTSCDRRFVFFPVFLWSYPNVSVYRREKLDWKNVVYVDKEDTHWWMYLFGHQPLPFKNKDGNNCRLLWNTVQVLGLLNDAFAAVATAVQSSFGCMHYIVHVKSW